MADNHVQDLLARLKPPGKQAEQSGHRQSLQASVSSPIYSPAPHGPQPRHSSAIVSPNVPSPATRTPASEMGPGELQKSLLGLLRFNSSAPTENAGPAENAAQPALSRGQSAQDIVNSAVRSPTSSQAAHTVVNAVPGSSRQDVSTQSSSETHEFLLNLLNNPKPAQSEQASKPDQSQAPHAKKNAFTFVNPFEQLSASSPRNRTPNPEHRSRSGTPQTEGHPKHAAGNVQAKPQKRDMPYREKRNGEAVGSVSGAVNDLGEELSKQVDNVLRDDQEAENLQEIEDEVKDIAATIKEELNDKETRERIEAQFPRDVVETLEEVADDIAEAQVADNWETAADISAGPVRVYNLPQRPFVSVHLVRLTAPVTPFKPRSFTQVARLKKDFDQIDRTLATASTNYIVYTLAKHGGFRLICQLNGHYKQIFQSTTERLFNITMCKMPRSSSRPSTESVIATGVNGSVFWVTLPLSDPDMFDHAEVESQGFVFPPEPAHDDNTSGSQLRTRAKKSSRHPDFFAIGRGRSIHIVFPEIARTAGHTKSVRVCDSAAYLRNRCLKIDTGKAGKDFTFSEDDTVIVSLDKAGRLRFWDIRALINSSIGWSDPDETVDIVLKEPVITHGTTAQGEKSWPTSVMFIDKERPTVKGSALRYLIVGMKQNHTLQLWDLGLGKPVQELNFPHDKESDGICSVVYHARTGMLIVGHPTRNSIYFINVSAPKYNIPSMNQAVFLKRLVDKDDPLPEPEATAIMGGIREFAFDKDAQLRSIDILSEPGPISEQFGQDEAALFELYIMHSKGVGCYGVRKEDLGWDTDNRIINAVDAEKDGYISVKEMKVIPQHEPSDASTNGEQSGPPPSSTRSVREKKDASSRASHGYTSEQAMIASTLARVENKQDQARAALLNGSEKSEKKKKKRDAVSQVSTPAREAPSYANAARGVSPSRTKDLATPAESSSDKDSRKTDTLTLELGKVVEQECSKLYRKLDEDRRVQAADGVSKQEALLRIVSSTLTDNIHSSLGEIVNGVIQSHAMPILANGVASAIDSKLSSALGPAANASIARELKALLPQAVNLAMQEPDVVKNVSDLVVQKVTKQLGSTLTNNIRQTIVPATVEATKKTIDDANKESEARLIKIIRQAEADRKADSAKIDQLTDLVAGLSQTVQSMAESQANFQRQLLDGTAQGNEIDAAETTLDPDTAEAQPEERAPSPPQSEYERVVELFTSGREEAGTVLWLQSANQVELFDTLFFRVDPSYVHRLSPLVGLSVCVAITASLEQHVDERIYWLESIFERLDPNHPEIQDVSGKILDITLGRLNTIHMTLSESNPPGPLHHRVAALARRCMGMRNSLPH